MANYEKPDHFTIKARKEGYPARSVYKLREADEKFRLVKRGASPFRVLDLGAAPGSWSLYVLRAAHGGRGGEGKNGVFLTAVDLLPLSREYGKEYFEGGGVFFVQGDMTDPVVRAQVFARGPCDLVMSDAAPSTTGNRSVDTIRSLALAETALSYTENLRPGGNFIVKVFQSRDSPALLKRMKTLFGEARSFKPAACRSESFETYFVGLRYQPPSASLPMPSADVPS
jgi:23S rRNA (uridine2552-2'-O)-methyltransferase